MATQQLLTGKKTKNSRYFLTWRVSGIQRGINTRRGNYRKLNGKQGYWSGVIDQNVFVMVEPKICLLIDDDPDDQEVFLTALSDVSSSVLCLVAPDGDRALELLHNEETIPHYIFLDLNMPRMNGFEFLAAMKKSSVLKNIPVIVYSTTSQQSQIDKVKKLGATEFFTKTYKYHELCALLKKYFGD